MIHPYLPRSNSRIYAAALVLAFVVSLPSHVVRAQVVWNNSGGTTDFNTATNWAGSTLPGTGSIATFTGAAAVQPNVSANISVSGINFSSAASTGYVLSSSGGATLSLLATSSSSGSAAITSANSSGTNEIAAPLVLSAAGGVGQYILQTGAGNLSLTGLISAAGSNPLAISTAGTVTLSQTNTYSGNILIFGTGSVSIASLGNSGSSGNLGSGSTVQLGIAANTGNLVYTGAGETTNRTIDISGTTGGASITSSGSGALVLSHNITTSGAGAKTLTLGGTNTASNTIQGSIVDSSSGATALAKSGGGFWSISGTNTYTGGTIVNDGTLHIGSNTALPSGGNVTVNSTVGGNATLQMGGTTAVNIGALTLGGTGGVAATNNVAINGSATLTLGGTVTYNATGNPLGSSIGSTGSTLALGGNRIIAVGNSTNAGAAVDLAIYANITGAGQSLTKTGEGYLTLSGANTYDGGTIINGGALQLNASNALASGRDVTVNTTTLATTAQFVLAGGFTQTIGALTLGGSASMGSTTLNNVTIAAGSTLTLGGNVTYDATGNQGASLIGGPGALALGATRTINVGDSSNTFSELTISAPITGTGFGLVKTGAGRLVVSGANTYDGGTTVNGGELFVNANGSLNSTGNILVNQGSGTATSALTIGTNVSQTIGSLTLGGAGGSATGTNNVFLFTGSTLTLGGTLTYDAASNPFGSTIWGSGGAPGTLALGANRTIAVGNSSAATDLTISTLVTGSGGLTKTGAGFLSMAGNASYSGGTIINDGTLFIGANTGLPSGGDVTVNSTVGGSATLQMGSTTAATIGALTLGGTGGVAASNSVAINGTAVLTLGGTLTYNASGNPVESTINGTGTLALGGNRIVAVGNSTNAGAATDLSIAAAISAQPGQSLTKTGAGFLIFTGAAKAYDGGTIIEGGTLQLNGSNLLTSTGNLTVNNQISGTTAAFTLASGLSQTIGALTFGGTTTAVGNTSINNVTIATGSTLTLGGTVTYDATANIGTSNITGGTLNLGGNRTFDVGNSTSTGSDLIIGSVVSGTGNLTKTGVGVLKLSSANSYVGDTTINGGQIFVSTSNNVLPTTSNIVVSQTGAGNATLSVYGSETAFLNQTISSLTLGGAGSTTSSANSVTIAGNSTLTLGGTLAYVATGNPLVSNISGGTLALGGNRTFDIGNSSTTNIELSVSSVISGGSLQVLTKTGAGTLRLLGANTYSSGTVVSAGGLVVANTTGSGVGTGALTIQSGAYLRGSGIIGGATTIEAGGIFGTGTTSSTTGNLTFTNGLTLNDGAVFNFQLGSVASDKITLMGGVLTGASTLGSLTINLNSGGTGNSFAAGTYTLFDFSTGGTTTSSFDVSDFTLGTKISGYTYNLAMNGAGNMLQLTATASAIPEPSTYAAILGALALAGAAWHRRRVRVRAVAKN